MIVIEARTRAELEAIAREYGLAWGKDTPDHALRAGILRAHAEDTARIAGGAYWREMRA